MVLVRFVIIFAYRNTHNFKGDIKTVREAMLKEVETMMIDCATDGNKFFVSHNEW